MKKKIVKVGTGSLLLLGLLAAGYLFQNPSSTNLSGFKPKKEISVSRKVDSRPQVESPSPKTESYEDRKARIDRYVQLLDEATKDVPKNPPTVTDLAKEPQKKLLKDQEGNETVEVTFADGSKSYYPNNERFDPSDGTFHPKEF